MYTAQLRVYPPEHISSLSTEPTFAPFRCRCTQTTNDCYCQLQRRTAKQESEYRIVCEDYWYGDTTSEHATKSRSLLPSRFGYSYISLEK